MLAAITAAAMLPVAGSGQIKASEHGTVSQTVDGTLMTLEYHRPSLRGRDTIFGGQVHYGELWTPGANWATTFEATRDLHMDGVLVPQGRYSVWMLVGPDDWEFVLEPEDSLFHTDPPELSDDQVRFMVTPQEVDFSLETLAWYFDDVRWNGAGLRMHWGETMVEIDVEVEPSFPMSVTPEEAAPYVGTYRAIIPARPEWGMERPDTIQTIVEFIDDRLLGRDIPSDPEAEGWTYQFLPRGEGFFIPGFMEDGEIWEVVDDFVYEFLFDDEGRASGFEVRMDDDSLYQTGERITAGR